MTSTKHRRLSLLGLLRLSGAHGYEVHAHHAGMGLIGLKRPAAYHLLETMEREGWLEHEEDLDRTHPRRVYHLTATGQQVLVDLQRDQLSSDEPPELPNLVSLTLLDLLPPDESIALLQERREQIQQAVNQMNLDADGVHAHSGIPGRVLAFVQKIRELEIELVDEILDQLAQEDLR